MNFVPAKVVEGGVQFGNGIGIVDSTTFNNAKGHSVTVGVRPEDLVITKGKGLEVEIDVVEELGADGYLYGRAVIDGTDYPVVVRVDGRNHPNRGEKIFVEPVAKHIHVFDTASGERLSTAVVD
jgi:multiple sugar transport system ATP-binding protein